MIKQKKFINPGESFGRSGLRPLFGVVLSMMLAASPTLTAGDATGYEVVDGANEDVLSLRPVIIDLDITAPDTRNAAVTGALADFPPK